MTVLKIKENPSISQFQERITTNPKIENNLPS